MADIREALNRLNLHVNGPSKKEWDLLQEEEETIAKLWRRASGILWAHGSPQSPLLTTRRDTPKVPLTTREGLDITLRLTGINPPDRPTNSSELVICWGGNEHIEDTLFVLTQNSAMVYYGYRLEQLTPEHLEAMNSIVDYIERGCVSPEAVSSLSTAS